VEFVSDRKALSVPCKPCKTVTDGQVLGSRLLEVLASEFDAVGIAANQIGVDARVCVIKVEKPIVLINPHIVGKFGKSFFQEGCLSFKGDYILTERWTDIVVTCDNHKNSLFFSFANNALECVCVQHEIDHLDGITMFDRAVEKELFDG
jgi:peptide deformylase|tara:strand:- start:5174 stop:5620 length:447 start_codon:yes stop_codon:yes gene_type:complete